MLGSRPESSCNGAGQGRKPNNPLVSPDALFSPWRDVAIAVKDSLIAAAEHGMYVDVQEVTDRSRGTFHVVTGAAEYRLVLTDRKQTLQRTDGPALAVDPVPIIGIEKLVVGEPGRVEVGFEGGPRTVMHAVQVGHELRTVNVTSIEHINQSEWKR